MEEDQRAALERLIGRSEELNRRIEAAVGLLQLEMAGDAASGGAGEPVDPSVVLEAALGRVASDARERGGALQCDVAADPPALRGRPDHLRRLFEAAVRFLVLDASPPVGRVRVRAWPPEEGRVRFGVLREAPEGAGETAGDRAGEAAGDPAGTPDAGGVPGDGSAVLELLVARRAAAVLRGELRIESGNRDGDAGVYLILPLFEAAGRDEAAE